MMRRRERAGNKNPAQSAIIRLHPREPTIKINCASRSICGTGTGKSPAARHKLGEGAGRLRNGTAQKQSSHALTDEQKASRCCFFPPGTSAQRQKSKTVHSRTPPISRSNWYYCPSVAEDCARLVPSVTCSSASNSARAKNALHTEQHDTEAKIVEHAPWGGRTSWKGGRSLREQLCLGGSRAPARQRATVDRSSA